MISETTVQLGSRVRISDADGEDEFVVEDYADVARGCISQDSPLGRALMGHRPGDTLQVRTPGGVRTISVVDVIAPGWAGSSASARPRA